MESVVAALTLQAMQLYELQKWCEPIIIECDVSIPCDLYVKDMVANTAKDAWICANGCGGMSCVIPCGKYLKRPVLTFLLSMDQCTRWPFKLPLNVMLIVLREWHQEKA
eukprot:6852364-Ditylum_brightwellii.AAC.1